jgi:hypothetical protein
MGRIGRTYPRHDLGQAFDVPAARQRLIFARRGTARRVPGFVWLATLACVLLLAWPAA